MDNLSGQVSFFDLWIKFGKIILKVCSRFNSTADLKITRKGCFLFCLWYNEESWKLIKKNMEKIKENLGELLTIIGVGLFVFNVFNFSYTTTTGFGFSKFVFETAESNIEGVAYYYPMENLLLITLGSMLVVAGFFIYSEKNRKYGK